MENSLEAWHNLCDYWNKHDGIDRSLACLLLEDCNWFISNSLTVSQLFCVASPIKNIWRDTYAEEDVLIEQNHDILSGWKLVGNGGISVIDMFSVVTIALEKGDVELLIEIEQNGDTQIQYYEEGIGYNILSSNINHFYSVLHRTNL